MKINKLPEKGEFLSLPDQRLDPSIKKIDFEIYKFLGNWKSRNIRNNIGNNHLYPIRPNIKLLFHM